MALAGYSWESAASLSGPEYWRECQCTRKEHLTPGAGCMGLFVVVFLHCHCLYNTLWELLKFAVLRVSLLALVFCGLACVYY